MTTSRTSPLLGSASVRYLYVVAALATLLLGSLDIEVAIDDQALQRMDKDLQSCSPVSNPAGLQERELFGIHLLPVH